jgi:hypothetical protein
MSDSSTFLFMMAGTNELNFKTVYFAFNTSP